jgi:hypothetical protein
MAWAEARPGAGDETDQPWGTARRVPPGAVPVLHRPGGRAVCELCDAVLCKQDRVHMLAELSLEPGHQRGHGALYDALNCGESAGLATALGTGRGAAAGLGRWPDPAGGRCEQLAAAGRGDQPGPVVLPLLRAGNNSAQMIPGWPYSLVAALEPGGRRGPGCWTRPGWVLMTTWPR